MKLMGCHGKSVQQQGFTLLELMVSVAILSIVAGVVVSGLTSLVQRNQMETTKVDLTQESRQFMDQIVSDIHQSGFPSAKMFDPASRVPASNPFNCNLYLHVASRLVNVTPIPLPFHPPADALVPIRPPSLH